MRWRDDASELFAWHVWFAWHPVRVGDERVWLEYVARRAVLTWDSYYWEYRNVGG